MTVTKVSTKPRRVSLTADGVLTDFDFDFKIFAEDEVRVYDDSVLQTITTDYTVTFDSEAETGTISFLSPPTDTNVILMVSNADYEQSTDIPKGGGFSEPVVEKAYDLLAIQIQQLKDGLDRAVTLSDTSSLTSLTVPDPDPGKAWLWNATGDGIENSTDDFNDIVTDATTQATAAAASASAAATSASAAATSASNAATSETNAALEVGYAAEWANKAEDSLVSAAAGGDLVDDYSALHNRNAALAWAIQAEDSAVKATFGGDGATTFSALHWAAKAAASATAAATSALVIPDPTGGSTGDQIRVNGAGTAYELFTPSAGATTFVGLSDTPANFTGAANQIVRVNGTPDALVFDDESNIDHDGLTNFVADEHVAHSSVTLTAGDGLSGGGTIAANRTFNVNITSETDTAIAAGDEILFSDVSDSNNIKKDTVQGILDLVSGGAGSGTASFSVYHSTGGGVISSNSTGQLLYNTEAFDTGGDFASNAFTAPQAGIYLFSAATRVNIDGTPGANDPVQFELRKNGSRFHVLDSNDLEPYPTNNLVGFSGSVVMSLASSDVITIYMVNGSDSDLSPQGGQDEHWFTGTLLA